MADLAAPLFRRSLPGLVDQRAEAGGVRALLAKGEYAIEVVGPGATRFGNIDADSLLAHVQYDYARFALSSLESHLLSRRRTYAPRAAAWPLVMLYYSAFYAGHAIMRATGVGVIRVDSDLPNFITKLGQIYTDESFDFPGGTYEYRLQDIGRPQMSMTLRRVDSGSAVHISFWSQFRRFLDQIGATAVANQEVEAQQIIARIEEFNRLLASSGPMTSGQLSEVRNAVSYRHEFAVWFPFISPDRKPAAVPLLDFRGNENIRLDYIPRREPRQAFTNASHFLASLSFDLAEMIIARARSSEFSRHWTRLKNDAQN